jgi:hypothetical protein
MDITFDYPIGVKKEVMSAFVPMFGSVYPDEQLRNRIKVTLDYPASQIQYPAIYVTYSEGPIENMGVGHIEYDTDENGNPQEVMHYRFQGQLNFNILALSPLERDRVAAGLVNLLAFGHVIPEFTNFKDELADGDYVRIVLLTDRITPQGQQTNPVPWGNSNELIYSQTYSVQLYGEFYSEVTTGDLVLISDVEVYPYLTGTLPPW